MARNIAAEERRFVSRNQWIRYMIKITGKAWKEPVHWLWWGRQLAQHYILSYWNRIQTEKVLHIKHHQQDLRSCLPQTLIEAYQRKLEAWARNSNIVSLIFNSKYVRMFRKLTASSTAWTGLPCTCNVSRISSLLSKEVC